LPVGNSEGASDDSQPPNPFYLLRVDEIAQSRRPLKTIPRGQGLSRSNGRTPRSAILVKTPLFAHVQIFDYRHIRSTLLATSSLFIISLPFAVVSTQRQFGLGVLRLKILTVTMFDQRRRVHLRQSAASGFFSMLFYNPITWEVFDESGSNRHSTISCAWKMALLITFR
jgi:hypothetical protein